MEGISELHASHIGRVKVEFLLSALALEPATITDWTGIQPDKMAKRGEERRNYKGDLIAPHDEGFWAISSAGKVNSKDINDHFSFLLDLLLPHREKLLRVINEMNGEAYFDVLWTSSYLYAGTGPVISREVLQGMSNLGASIGFDIYQEDIPVRLICLWSSSLSESAFHKKSTLGWPRRATPTKILRELLIDECFVGAALRGRPSVDFLCSASESF